MLEIIIFSLLNGLVYGLLLFMLSSGLTLIFSMMGVLNLAHAALYMLGAYLGFTIAQHVGYWPGLIVAPLGVGVFGALIERYGLRNVHKFGHIVELILTFGIAFLIDEGVQFIWGKDQQPYTPPEVLDGPLFTLFNAQFPAYKGFMLLLSVAIFLGLLVVLTRSRVGLIIQAAITHPNTVAMLGHNVPGIFMVTFGVGSALAGLAGAIAGPVMGTYPGMAFDLGTIVFVVVVFGGLGSLAGAFVASLLIGMVQTCAIALDFSVNDFLTMIGVSFPPDHILNDLWTLSLPQIAPILPYLMMVLMLIFRPTGLLGTRET
jgi:branched-chain amino acid transport system permease protein